MGAQDVPQLLVAALADQVQVHFAHGGEVAVRLVHRHGFRALVGHFQPVVRHVAGLQGLQHGDPDAVGLMGHGHGAGCGHHGDRPRPGA